MRDGVGGDVAETLPRTRHDEPLPAQADVAVVGGGAIGLCVAYELARHGRRVVVLEGQDWSTSTSSGNAGFIVPSHVIPVTTPGMVAQALKSLAGGRGPVTVRPSLKVAFVRWCAGFLRHCNDRSIQAAASALASLAESSASLYPRLLADEGIDCAFEPNGLLKIFGTARAFATARRDAEWEARFGVCNHVLGGDAAKQLEPSLREGVAGAVFYPNDAGLDPGLFLAGLAAALAKRGVLLASHTQVLAARVSAGTVESLATSRGNIRVDEVVLAAGARTPAVAALFGGQLPIQPAKGYSVTARRPRRGPSRRLLLGDEMVAVAPIGERLRLAGWFELGRFDDRLPANRLARIERSVRGRVHLDAVLEVEQRWAGFRPVTPDGVPIIGRAPALRNVTYAAGHAMLGITLAPATGRLVAQLVCGAQTDVDAAPFSPARFG